jgi:diguanylate cyclase (GGDEF)-like protein
MADLHLKRTGIMPRSMIVSKLIGGINIPGSMRSKLGEQVSLILSVARDADTGRIRPESVAQISSEVHSQILAALGYDQCKGMGITQASIEAAIRDNRLVQPFTLTEQERKEAEALTKRLLETGSLVESPKSDAPAGSLKEGRLKTSVLNIIYEIFKNAKISGYGAYLRDLLTSKLVCRLREKLEGESRFGIWRMPHGEKRQQPEIIESIRKKYEKTNNPSLKRMYSDLLNQLSGWAILNRREWPEYAMNSGVAEDLRKRLEYHGIDGIEKKIGGADPRSRSLVRILISMTKEKLCLSDEQIRIDGGMALGEYLREEKKKEKIIDVEEIERLKKVLEAAAVELARIAKIAVNDVFLGVETAAKKYAKDHKIVCPLLDENVFKFSVYNFIGAQNDLAQDMNILGDQLSKALRAQNIQYDPDKLLKFVELCAISGLNVAIRDKDNRPVAGFIAHNHVENATVQNFLGWLATGKLPGSAFNDDAVLQSLIRKFINCNNAIAAAIIAQRNKEQLEIDAKEREGLLELADIVNDGSKSLQERLKMASEKIATLCQTNGTPIGCTIQLIKGKRKIIAAAWNKKPGIMGTEADIGEGISGHVAITQEALFLDEETMSARPELYALRQKSMSEKDDKTSVHVPIILKGEQKELQGVINVDGDKISPDIVKLLQSAAATISPAIKNAEQTEELRIKNTQAEIAGRTDKLTGVFNRRYHDQVYPGMYERAVAQGLAISIIFLDVDGLKLIDEVDHPAGDHYLATGIGWINEYTMAKTGEKLLCRFGGDEFVIPLIGMDGNAAYDFAAGICEHLREKQPFKFTGENIRDTWKNKEGYQFSVTMGVAGRTPEVVDASHLLKRADQATIVGKRQGKNRALKWTSEVGRTAQEIMEREQREAEEKRKAEANADVHVPKAEALIAEQNNDSVVLRQALATGVEIIKGLRKGGVQIR